MTYAKRAIHCLCPNACGWSEPDRGESTVRLFIGAVDLRISHWAMGQQSRTHNVKCWLFSCEGTCCHANCQQFDAGNLPQICDTQDMKEPDSPTLARFVLGRTLKRLRLEAKVELKNAAAICGVVETTISRWEVGASPPKPPVIMALGNAYGASEADIAKMSTWANKAKRRGLFEGSDVPVDARMLFEAEHVAHAIRGIELEYVPGLLQTPEYLATMQSAVSEFHTAEMLAKIRNLRERRQAAQAARQKPVIMQYVVGLATMAYLDQMPGDVRKGQIARLLEAAKSGVDIRVLTKPHAAMLGSYTMIQISPDHPPFVYVESLDAGRYLEGENVLSPFEQTFVSAQKSATALEEYLG